MNAADLIRHLELRPHPEGGWFRETYRSAERIAAGQLPARYGGARAFSTAIYFLLEAGQCSSFHRIQSDECWFHHAGGDLDVLRITDDGRLFVDRIGPGVARWQTVVPRGEWFAARPAEDALFVLVGCTVAPGFDFTDFELATRDALTTRFPQHADTIRSLTRN